MRTPRNQKVPSFTFGPGVKQAITWVMILSSFSGGYYFGAKDQWGLASTLAIVTDDQKAAKKIIAEKDKTDNEIDELEQRLNHAKLHTCADMSMDSIMREQQSTGN